MAPDMTNLELDLHRYVDNQLDLDGRKQFEEALLTHPELANKVVEYARQRDGLQTLFAALPDARAQISDCHRPLPFAKGQWSTLRQGALAASLLLVGLIGGWSGALLTADTGRGVQYAERVDQVAADAFSAHRVFVVDRRHPVEVGREEEAHLVAWLSNRMEREILAPNFSSAGLELVGGRLLPSSDGPSAQLMYENSQGDRVTLYLRTGNAEPADGVIEKDGDLKAVLWSSHDLNYAVIGGVETSKLLDLSKLSGLKSLGSPSAT